MLEGTVSYLYLNYVDCKYLRTVKRTDKRFFRHWKSFSDTEKALRVLGTFLCTACSDCFFVNQKLHLSKSFSWTELPPSNIAYSQLGEQGNHSEWERARGEDVEGSWQSVNKIQKTLSYRHADKTTRLIPLFQRLRTLNQKHNLVKSWLEPTLSGLIYKKKMGSKRYRSKTFGKTLSLNHTLLCIIWVLFTLFDPFGSAFNLDVENPTVYSGPNGSYFGYSVEFYLTNSARWVHPLKQCGGLFLNKDGCGYIWASWS